MDDARVLRRKSLEMQAESQAFDYARQKAGDVTELFGVLAGKLRPGRQTPEESSALGGTSLSNRSVLRAQYHGSSGSTVLGMANLERIQTFLDEPRKHLGQVIADIEKETGSFYSQVSSRRQGSGAGTQRMQRGESEAYRTEQRQRVCLEEVPEMNKYLGPSSRFGDGDGSFWDRWLTSTGHFTEQGDYSKADMPTRSMYATGMVIPQSGFKRYQLDKLAFTREPEPRVLSYAARRELGEKFKTDGVPRRLCGAYSEKTFATSGRERLDSTVLDKATEAFQISAQREQPRQSQELKGQRDRGSTSGGKREFSAASSSRDVHSTGREDPEQALAAINASFRTMGTAGSQKTSKKGSEASNAAMNFEPDKGAATGTEITLRERDESSTCIERNISRLERDDCSLEGAIASSGSVHPNYFGRQARTHVYDYFKQVSRRRHQYGDPQAVSLISLAPADHVGAIPAYKAGLDAVSLDSDESLDDIDNQVQEERKGRHRQHQLPPLATAGNSRGIGGLKGEASGEDLEAQDGEPADHHITSRTKYLVRCMECNVAPRAHVIIRKTHTTKVNLAHQGMGDVMGAILADCLVGLPLMRELNLRDNMLTDKGLMPIVKAIKQRHDLYALDLSENKLDRWAARELALYFSDPRCTLAKLILSKADVDDFEASNFVKHMKANKTLTHLDLSHNLIGSQESINYVRPEFYTGAEAAADWISTGSCPLKYLDLSWNTIRLDSAVYFGNAVAYATDLEELDLSFNCFGAKGGEAIGASLHVNTSLKTLGLASNAINPRACFVICQGLLQNSSIQNINLSNNSLGKVGVGCVMALPAEVGDRITTHLANCNFMVDCHECWFDDEQLRPSYDLRMDEPYDRAVAFHLIRRAARDQGLELKRVAHTMAGEAEKDINLVAGSGQSTRRFPDKATQEATFRKYDNKETGSIESEDLGKALVDLGLAGENQVDLLMARHDDGNEQVEELEFYDCIEESIRQSKRREGRSRAFLAEQSSQDKPWIVPPEGQLRLELEYQRLHNQGYHTSPESTDGLLAMLSGIGDGLADVMGHALNFLSLNLDQGMKIYASVRKRIGGDKIKALAKVIPRMESPHDARLLMSTVLRDPDERRKLRHELGPAYRPLMGTPMGHYELDLSKPTHQLAARKILEWNNLEKLERQTGTLSVFDISQRGNWDNTRNETVNGKPYRLKGTIFEALPRAGALEVDYVSTSRPLAGNGDGADRSRRKKPMSTKKFYDMLGSLGLGNGAAWIDRVKTDVDERKNFNFEDARQFDRIMDNALRETPPRPRTRILFEHLRFLMSDEGQSAVKKAMPARPSVMDKNAVAGSPKQSPQRRQSVPPSSTSSKPSTLPTDGLASKSVQHMGTRSKQDTTASPVTGLHLEATIGINTMACRLDELMADKWFSIRQCRFVLLVIQEAFDGDELLQDVLVDFVVTVYPRVVDVHDYLTLVGCLEDRSQAFVIKRVGWLAAWNPCCPEGYMELGLDSREERQVAKMLIHLAFDQHGEHWASSSFRWAIHDPLIPGWMLPAAWHTEEGLPTRGILACTHAKKPGNTRINWVLRVALAQVVSLGGGPVPSAFGRADNEANLGIAREDSRSDQDKEVADSVPVVRSEKHPADKRGVASPSSTGFEHNFDRNFVDSLCKQASSDFFLYGTQHSNASATEDSC